MNKRSAIFPSSTVFFQGFPPLVVADIAMPDKGEIEDDRGQPPEIEEDTAGQNDRHDRAMVVVEDDPHANEKADKQTAGDQD